MTLDGQVLLGALAIFALRILGVSVSTLRILITVQGRRLLSCVMGFFEALVFAVALGSVVTALSEFYRVGEARGEDFKITLTGNGHARRMLVECAWSYRFPARQTMHLKRKAETASPEAKAIAWRAQKRLCGRYRQLSQAGKNIKLVCVAIARELVGFLWDIVRHEMPRVQIAPAGR